MDIIKLISKRLNIMIGIMIFCFAVCIVTILFYKPHVANSSDELLNEALEKQRQATVEQRQATQKMIEQAQVNITYLQKRDSAISAQLDETNNNIKKVRDEKIKSYGNYNSADLQRAFAEIARQHRNP